MTMFKIHNVAIDEVDWRNADGVVIWHKHLGFVVGAYQCPDRTCRHLHFAWSHTEGFGSHVHIPIMFKHGMQMTPDALNEIAQQVFLDTDESEWGNITFHIISDKAGDVKSMLARGASMQPPMPESFVAFVKSMLGARLIKPNRDGTDSAVESKGSLTPEEANALLRMESPSGRRN